MGAVELRDIVLKYIHTADERLLRVVKAMIESYQEEEIMDENDEISAEHKKELDNRLESYKKNPDNVLDWEDVKHDW